MQVQVEYAVHEMDPLMSLLWSADERRACQGTGANVFGVFAVNLPVKSSQSHDFEIELFVGEEWQAVAEQMPGQGQRDGDDMLKCCVGESVSLVCRIKAIGRRLGHVTNPAAAALEYALDVPAGGGWLLAGRTRGSLASTRDESKEWLTRCWMMPTLCGRLALPVLSLQGVTVPMDPCVRACICIMKCGHLRVYLDRERTFACVKVWRRSASGTRRRRNVSWLSRPPPNIPGISFRSALFIGYVVPRGPSSAGDRGEYAGWRTIRVALHSGAQPGCFSRHRRGRAATVCSCVDRAPSKKRKARPIGGKGVGTCKRTK